MKILAEVRLKHWKNVEHLMRNFCKNVKESDKILIKGNIAKVEYFAKNGPPEDLMSALIHCEVKHIEYDMTETKSIITAEDESFQITSDSAGNPHEDYDEEEKHKTEEDLIQMLEALPKETEREFYTEKIVAWVGLGEDEKGVFLIDLLSATVLVKKINWDNLAEEMKSKYSKNFDTIKRSMSKYISSVFNNELKLMKFLKIVTEYIK